MARRSGVIGLIGVVGALLTHASAALAACPPNFPELPVLGQHIEESAITYGTLNFEQIRAAGGRLFTSQFNICDGLGRPATTGGGKKRQPTQPFFIRTSSPDSMSCAACHL